MNENEEKNVLSDDELEKVSGGITSPVVTFQGGISPVDEKSMGFIARFFALFFKKHGTVVTTTDSMKQLNSSVDVFTHDL